MTVAGARGGRGTARPRLSLARIAQMNIGFFRLQFSFGLQQSNMAPICSYLGADPGSTLLSLARPITGLLVHALFGGGPRAVLSFAGLLMFAAAAATLAIGRPPRRKVQA